MEKLTPCDICSRVHPDYREKSMTCKKCKYNVHKFGFDADNESVAIVETMDGNVATVSTVGLQFIDRINYEPEKSVYNFTGFFDGYDN